MRDIARIDKFLKLFGELWKKYPDLRFGQLTSIIEDDFNAPWFYVEDDILQTSIKKKIQEGL